MFFNLNGSNPTPQIDNVVLSKMSIQLFYGSELNLEANYSAAKLSDDEFEHAKEEYNKMHNLVSNMFDYNGIIEYTYEKCNLTHNNIDYHYVFKVSDNSIYLIEDLKGDDEVSALFYINGNYYPGQLEFEVDKDETEIEMSYYDGDYLISIQRDYELDEYEVEYRISLGNDEIETYEISVDIEDEYVCEIEHKTLSKEVYIKIIVVDNHYEIEYKEESNEYDFQIKMKLEITDGEKNFEILQ